MILSNIQCPPPLPPPRPGQQFDEYLKPSCQLTNHVHCTHCPPIPTERHHYLESGELPDTEIQSGLARTNKEEGTSDHVVDPPVDRSTCPQENLSDTETESHISQEREGSPPPRSSHN